MNGNDWVQHFWVMRLRDRQPLRLSSPIVLGSTGRNVLTIDANVWVADFDPQDHFHERSAAFLRLVAERDLRLHGPAFVALEAACASARRTRDPEVGRAVRDRLSRHPALRLHPLNDRCLAAAHEVGVRLLLRGADSLYVAIARLTDAPLVTWDNELIRRAGAVSPEQWLSDHA